MSQQTQTPAPPPLADVQSETATHAIGQQIRETFDFRVHWT